MVIRRKDMTLQDLINEYEKDPDFDLASFLADDFPLDDEGNPYDSSLGKKEIDGMVIENGVLKRYNGNMKDIKIPDEVISISSAAFKGKEDIETIHMTRSVEHIAKGAFAGCKKLRKVTCPIKYEFEIIDIFGEDIDNISFDFTIYMLNKEIVYAKTNGKKARMVYYADKALKDSERSSVSSDLKD